MYVSCMHICTCILIWETNAYLFEIWVYPSITTYIGHTDIFLVSLIIELIRISRGRLVTEKNFFYKIITAIFNTKKSLLVFIALLFLTARHYWFTSHMNNKLIKQSKLDMTWSAFIWRFRELFPLSRVTVYNIMLMFLIKTSVRKLQII